MTENKNEITLDSLMKSQPEMPAAQAQVITEEVEKQIQVLSEAERHRVEEIKDTINLQDAQLMSVYGSSSQKNIAQFSDQILSEVRSKDVGDVGDLMSDLMVKVQDLDVTKIEGESFLDKLPFFKNTKRNIQKYLAKYDVMETQIDKIQSQLENARMELLKDVGTFDRLYEQNVAYFNELQLYIVAGEEKIADVRNNVIPNLFKEAEAASDPMAMQVVKDFQETVDRFEKKIFDLKTSKTVAIQTAPQIKLIQNNDKLLIDKVTDAINNTIPLWKSQVVIALGMNKQGQVLEMQKEVSNTTNELLRRNSEKLKQNTIEVTKEAERSTIDMDTLKKVNADLIETIEESIKIHNDAKKARANAEVEIQKIENDLKDSMAKAIVYERQANQ